MATKKKEETEVTAMTTTGPTAVAEYVDYGEDEGAGQGDRGRDDVLIPFMAILQPMSPQVVNETVAGAKAGMFINTATQEIYDGKTGVEFVAVLTGKHNFVEFAPRDEGGGFRGNHLPGDKIVVDAEARRKAEGGKFGKLKTEEGNELVETFYAFCIRLENGEPVDKFVIGFKSTMIKEYKRLMTRLENFKIRNSAGDLKNPPVYGIRLRATTEKQQNDQGTWFNIKVEPAMPEADGKNALRNSLLPPGSEVLALGRAFRAQILGGDVEANYAKSTNAEGAEPEPF